MRSSLSLLLLSILALSANAQEQFLGIFEQLITNLKAPNGDPLVPPIIQGLVTSAVSGKFNRPIDPTEVKAALAVLRENDEIETKDGQEGYEATQLRLKKLYINSARAVHRIGIAGDIEELKSEILGLLNQLWQWLLDENEGYTKIHVANSERANSLLASALRLTPEQQPKLAAILLPLKSVAYKLEKIEVISIAALRQTVVNFSAAALSLQRSRNPDQDSLIGLFRFLRLEIESETVFMFGDLGDFHEEVQKPYRELITRIEAGEDIGIILNSIVPAS